MSNPFEPINARLTNLEALTLEVLQLLRSTNTISDSSTDEDMPLGIQEAADFLGISRQTIYQNIGNIPHKKRFGRLYFFRTQLSEYLNAGEGVSHE